MTPAGKVRRAGAGSPTGRSGGDKEVVHSLDLGFPASATCSLNQKILSWGRCPGHCRMHNGILASAHHAPVLPTFFSLPVSSPHISTTKNVSRHCLLSPGWQHRP